MDTEQYFRKPFTVDAVLVTTENMYEVAGEGFKVYGVGAFEKSFQKLERIHPNQLEIEMDLRIHPNQLEIDGDPEEVSLGGELVHKDQGVFEAIDFSKSELAVAEVTP